MNADAWAAHEAVAAVACARCGRESCDEPLHTTQFLTADDVITEALPETVVDGLAWAGSATMFVGESGAGKTFCLLDLASCVGSGIPWHGRVTQLGSVAYCSWEGDGFKRRILALRAAGQSTEGFHLLRCSQPISPIQARDTGEMQSAGEIELADRLAELSHALALAGRPPIRLLIIDTVRTSLAGSEDASDNVASYLRAVKRLVKALPGAGAILAHHAGWQDGEGGTAGKGRKRERGSSAWRGNGDGTVYLEVVGGDSEGDLELSLKTIKTRDDTFPHPLPMKRRRVVIPSVFDNFGRPVTSCHMVDDDRSPEERAVAAKAAQEERDRPQDLVILRTVRNNEGMTSLQAISGAAHISNAACKVAVDRLVVRRLLIAPPKQRQPYRLSHEGSDLLSRSESFPLVPVSRSE
jgi:RecA-family ATPase